MEIFDFIAVFLEGMIMIFYGQILSSKANQGKVIILSLLFSIMDLFLIHQQSFVLAFLIEFVALFAYSFFFTNGRQGLYYASYMMQFMSLYHVLFLLFVPEHNVARISVENHLITLFMSALSLMVYKEKGWLRDFSLSIHDDGQLFVILVISAFVLPLSYTIHPDLNAWQLGDYLFIIFIILVLCGVTMLMNHMITIMSENTRMKMVESSYHYIELYKQSIDEKNKEIHKIRHDLKKQLSIIDELSKEGQQETAHRLYETLDDFVKQKTIDYTGNVLCDAYIEAMKHNHDDFRINMTSDHIGNIVDERKFMLIVANLIENAYKNTSDPIDFSCSVYKGHLTLKVVNTIKRKQTSPSEHLGLEIVREIVKELGGELFIDEQNHDLFIVYVDLPVTES